jgi:YfiH family protein
MPNETPPPLTGLRPRGLGLGLRAFMSTREGGVSAAPWDRLNLGRSVGDDPAAVAENRRRVAALMGAEPVYLHQVHGSRCVLLREPPPEPVQADAAVTVTPGLPLAIQVADCLPVLLTALDPQGRALAVGGAHAGWRGLAGGVLESTVAALREWAPDNFALRAWMGPCIGPAAFEVGADVLEAFGRSPDAPGPHFRPRTRPDGSLRWLADLHGLARDRLHRLGVEGVFADPACTFSDASRFFSFRRDGTRSGRMAAFIALG